jgi:hypothetical protein
MTDRVLIAAELLAALEDAVRGNSHWRFRASALLRSIARYELPPLATEALRKIDGRKRAAEIMNDACQGPDAA